LLWIRYVMSDAVRRSLGTEWRSSEGLYLGVG
jgi:hypothetical protein